MVDAKVVLTWEKGSDCLTNVDFYDVGNVLEPGRCGGRTTLNILKTVHFKGTHYVACKISQYICFLKKERDGKNKLFII